MRPVTSELGGPDRYPFSMRAFHWLRALLLVGLIALGWYMTALPEAAPIKFALYPIHKQLGVTVLLIAIAALFVRGRSVHPAEPRGLSRFEAILSRFTHRALLVLAIVVPLMGYAMSSSYVDSDGVPFLFMMLPELLPKSDLGFAVFQWLHRLLAYALLALALLHVIGALKHRLVDRGGESDVLGRML